MGPSTARVAAFKLTGPGRAPADWLPTPVVVPVSRPNPARRPAQARRTWLMPPRRSIGERVMMALLAGAAISGIGYGFVCLLNLVQNWAVFYAGVTHLVQ
jgi:hypothetical protein